MRTLSVLKNKDDIIARLNVLADSYASWIQEKLVEDSKMADKKFREEIGNDIINKCVEALNRIRAGIQLLVEDAVVFDAFCFMNRAMILQRNIMISRRSTVRVLNVASRISSIRVSRRTISGGDRSRLPSF